MEDFNDKVYRLEQCREYEAIIKLCNKEIDINPNNWEPYFHKSMAQYGLKQFPHALLTINKSIELNQNSFNLTHKGNVLWKLGDYTGAINSASEALEYNNTSTSALSLRSDVYLSIGEYTKALVDARNILTIAPTHADALSIIADIERENGDYSNSIETKKLLTVLQMIK